MLTTNNPLTDVSILISKSKDDDKYYTDKIFVFFSRENPYIPNPGYDDISTSTRWMSYRQALILEFRLRELGIKVRRNMCS